MQLLKCKASDYMTHIQHASHRSPLQQPRRRQQHAQMQQKMTSVRKAAAPAIKTVMFKGSVRTGRRVYAQSLVCGA